MKLFKTIPIYLRLYKNKVKVYRLDSGKFVIRESEVPFSNSRILWGDFQKGEDFVNRVIKDLIGNKSFFPLTSFQMLIHQMELIKDGLSEVEKRALIDSARHLNAKEVDLYFGEEELSVKNALNELEKS